jgi:hypothetical protein
MTSLSEEAKFQYGTGNKKEVNILDLLTYHPGKLKIGE